jgi:hypothetical protein
MEGWKDGWIKLGDGTRKAARKEGWERRMSFVVMPTASVRSFSL